MQKSIKFTILSTLTLFACDPEDPAPLGETGACTGVEVARVELTRTPGAPNVATTGTFMSTAQLCIEVTAGKGDKATAPSSALVSLSDFGTIVGPMDFKNESWTRSFLVDAGSYGQRELTIDLASTPGSYVEAVVFEQGLDGADVPAGSTPAVIYPEQSGQLQLEQASLTWGPGTVAEPLLIWCSESQGGPELVLECGPSTQFKQALTVSLPVSEAMMAETLAKLDTEGKAPTIVWDGEPRATITEVTANTAYAAIEHFCTGTVQLLEYVTEANKGEITEWAEELSQEYPHQTIEYPIIIGSAAVGDKKYRKYIIPKRPEISLDINLQTLKGDADLFTNYTSLADTSRSSNQYSSTNWDLDRDAVSVPVTKAGLYFAAVQGYEDSSYRMMVKPVLDDNQSDAQGKWTVILDAGHGLNEDQLEQYGPADCDGWWFDDGFDDENAAYERTRNQIILAAAYAELQKFTIEVLPHNQVEVVTYDGTILPWAATADTPILEHRWRETQMSHGCAGYRGLLMRQWVDKTERDPKRTVALQIHNDTYSKDDELGSEASNLGFEGGDGAWLARMQEAMNRGMCQPWLGVLSPAHERQAFVRGASGYTNCGGNVPMLEENCNVPHIKNRLTEYGNGLHSASLLEVAHYDAFSETQGDIFFSDPHGGQYVMTDDMFLEHAGQMIAFEIERYLLAQIHPSY